MKSPSAVRALTAPIAAPSVLVGRMIEQTRELSAEEGAWLRHDQVGLEHLWLGKREGPEMSPLNRWGRRSEECALPALSCQV